MTDFEKERTAAEKLAEANHTVPGPAAVSGNITSADSETSSGEEGTPAPANPAERTDASVEQAAAQTEDGACVPATSESGGGSGSKPPSDIAVTGGADLPAPAARDGDEDGDGTEEEEDGEDGEGGRMSFMDHLRELRRRLCYCVAAAFVGFCVCMFFVEPIFNVLTKPLIAALPPGSTAMYTTLPEAFFTRMYIAFMSGLFLVSPLIFYEIWAFISPGLYEEEKRFIIPVALISAVFFVGGGLFCYYIVFHYAFQFFMSFATEQIVAAPKISDYLDFVMKLLLAFGLIFEMPIFTFFLSRMGVVTAQRMRRARRYAVLVIFIVAAILTPPDVVSQLLMAVPMLILYEVSILVAVIFGKKKPVPAEGEEEEPEDGDDGEGSLRSSRPEDDEAASGRKDDSEPGETGKSTGSEEKGASGTADAARSAGHEGDSAKGA